MASDGAQDTARFDGTIHVMPYTHADIAWVHTRAWHIDRYTRAMDEVLALYEADPDYHYYVDTWVELMKPYIRHRPQNIDAIRRRVGEGRLAVCGGQFGNVRSTAVGSETQVRNLQLGMRRWRELAPDVRFRVHSNIDVTFGHTQMPQLLRLAGLEAYFVMRPLAALDAQGVPRAFWWKGLSGDRILVYRDTGVGLFTERDRRGPCWEHDWPGVLQHIDERYTGAPILQGLRHVGLSVGVDDSRPERFAFNDVPAGYADLIRTWNARQPSTMRYGTPDTLVEAILERGDELPVVDAVLDPTCVSFNIALNGRRGIWWLRELADRLLVQAETLASLAAADGRAPYPEAEFTDLWETLLSWTPHAVQWLFREDWQEGELALRRVAADAEARARASISSLVGSSLPMDAGAVVCINTLPRPAREVVPLWVINTDLTRGLVGFTDPEGRTVPMQAVACAVPGAEVEALVEVELPPCGFATLVPAWEAMPGGLAQDAGDKHWRGRLGLVSPRVVGDGSLTLASDCVSIVLADGHVVEVSDGVPGGRARRAPAGASFLEPLCYAVERTLWHADAVAGEPARFEVRETRLDEAGPLRWRVTRTGAVGGFWVRQHLDLLKGESAVRSTLQFMDPASEDDLLLAIGVPIPDEAELTVDIPFGAEPRPVDRIRYGISERSVDGLFWGRTWAEARTASGSLALVAADGDKLFRAHGSPRRLVHILAQKTRVFQTSWEAYIDTSDVGGRQVFHHIAWLGDAGAPQTALHHLADRIRQPVRQAWVSAPAPPARVSLAAAAPSTLSLSALVWEGDALLVRVVQLAPNAVEAALDLPFEVGGAETVDLQGRPLPGPVTWSGRQVRLAVSGYQIATVRVTRAQE